MKPILILLVACLCLTLQSPDAMADRRTQSMSENVRGASVIAIVDARRDEARAFEATLIFREILKGEDQKIGDTLLLSPQIEGPYLPPDARGWAALFAKDAEGKLFLLETYGQPQEIEALRHLVSINRLPSEHERLLALRALIADKNPLDAQNFLDELHQMREPGNYPILLDSFPFLDDAGQVALVKLIDEIGDPRGLPKLIELFDAPNPTPAQRRLALEAVHPLTFVFPGAPGVTEAFRRALKTEHLRSSTLWYLSKRDPNVQAEVEAIRTPYQKARALAEAGDYQGARRLWLSIAENAQESDWTRLDVALSLINSPDAANLNEAEQEYTRRALLPLLARIAREGDYGQAEKAAQVLRALHHEDAVEPLLDLLVRKEAWLFQKSARIATMALLEAGEAARQQAVVRLRYEISNAADKSDNQAAEALFAPLIWRGDADSDAQVARLLSGTLLERWNDYAPLRSAALSKDETGQLIALLQAPGTLPSEAMSWIIFRLREKKDARAALPLLADLASHPWREPQELIEAIAPLGGPEVDREIVKLLTHPDRDNVRRQVVDLLVRRQGEKSLPLLRRMIAEPDFGSRSQALFQLAYVGTPDDLPLLQRLSDYWTGDRTNHYRVMHALANIRNRYNYDVNGPIQTSSSKRD